MMKHLFLLLILSPLLLASSAVNFSTVGNLGGVQATDWTSAGVSTITATTTNPTKGTVVTDSVKWRRVGDSMEIRWDYEQSATGASGSGKYLLLIPGGYSIDTSKQSVSTVPKYAVGFGYFSNNSDSISGTSIPGTVFANDSTHISFAALTTTSTQTEIGSALFGFGTFAIVKYTIYARVPISGWSSTSPNGSTSSVLSSGSNYRVDSAILTSACAITSQSGSWISGTPSHSGTGQCTITVAAGEFSASPTCSCSNLNGNGASRACNSVGSSSTSVITSTSVNGTTQEDAAVSVICMGPH